MSTFSTNAFTGGMNNWLHPSLLEKDTAQELTDATIENGKITAVKFPLKLTYGASHYGHNGNRNRSVVTWYDREYWSENTATSAPYYGGDTEALGIPYPEKHPVLTAVAVEESEDDSEAEKSLTGDYKYCWCYVNENGWESAPCAEDGELWAEITVENSKITVEAPESFPDGISYIKIYRTTDKGGDFYCVGEITAPGGDFIDDVDDNTLLMKEAASSFDNYPPPEKGKYLTESGGVFFLAVADRVYFSVQNNPHAWPTLNFIGVDDVITGITPEFQGVLVFTANNTYRIVGAEDIETVTKSLLPGNQGCVNFRTVAHVSNAPIWLSNDGICLWDGESVSIISNHVFKTDRLQVLYACSANDTYYLFLLDRTIVYDKRNGGVFRQLSFTGEYAWYDGKTDKMFLEKSGILYEWGAGITGQFQYVSPYIGGSDMAFKQFLEVLAVCSAPPYVTVFLDDVKIASASCHRGGRIRIKLPHSSTGQHLHVQIKSTGELSEFAVIYE